MIKNLVVGKVLWWSEKNENGVIVDPQGNEYYFDRSVIELKKRQKLERNSWVTFKPARCDEVLSAKSVSLPMARMKKKLEKKYEEERYQLSLPIGF